MSPETHTLWSIFLEAHKNVLLYTVDPGAYALGMELSQLLQSAGHLQGWYAEGWSSNRRPKCLPIDELPLSLVPGSTLLLGSQTNFARTHHFTRLAKISGARSIFVFDHWKNYAEHFQADALPDQIVVPDEMGKVFLQLAIGMEHAGRISVLPHLGIDAAVERILAHKMRLPGNIVVLLDPTEVSDELGYDWRGVLQEVGQRAQAMPAVTFNIKPHPRQKPEEVQHFVDGLGLPGRLKLVDLDTEELIAAVDEVWGMTTIALVAALKAGKIIKSMQGGRNEKGKAASNHYLEPYLI
ncbi:hypothetical protein [Rhodoferax saidenbachensis]|uniref:Uncharacterized protein n=1 Tax=Rhodoferax saidenbachensis TaxID=1484693 RepID=A0ABU1ZKG7_9BURK|nr:hypothetical protein [Rhodoferax saidenbachensis]MDR7306034.1 hypothetical protein [Rhodoferax saidenbachensis]